jgi:hypothetical protein
MKVQSNQARNHIKLKNLASSFPTCLYVVTTRHSFGRSFGAEAFEGAKELRKAPEQLRPSVILPVLSDLWVANRATVEAATVVVDSESQMIATLDSALHFAPVGFRQTKRGTTVVSELSSFLLVRQ